MVKFTLINHASCLLEFGDFKLLCDPWFEGNTFNDGWGLKWEVEDPLKFIEKSTHLWISHFHEDHLNKKTLEKILEKNKNIIILANDSFNFKISFYLKKLGFKNIFILNEREKYHFENVILQRFPATGIDNFLLIQYEGKKYLNLNDVNLSQKALRLISKKIGKIEIILTNFNHAGKLLKSSFSRNKVYKSLIENYQSNLKPFKYNFSLPFASYHYYRSPEASLQNETLVEMNQLKDLGENVIPLQLGQTLDYDPNKKNYDISNTLIVKKNKKTYIKRDPKSTVDQKELLQASMRYLKKINKSMFYFTFFIRPLNIMIYDLDILIKIQFFKNKAEINNSAKPDISMHSSIFKVWLNSRFSTDIITVGAHFNICHSKNNPIIKYILIGMLYDNNLALKDIFKMLFSIDGIKFLINRREEIIGLILTREIMADYQK